MSYDKPDGPAADFLGRPLTRAIHSSSEGGRATETAKAAAASVGTSFFWKFLHMWERRHPGMPLCAVRVKNTSSGEKT